MNDLIPKLRNTDSNNFFLIAGPCAIEGEEIAFEIAEQVSAICDRLRIPYVFKGSYRKANRSRIDSFTGIGDEQALDILKEENKKYDPKVIRALEYLLAPDGDPETRQLFESKDT